MIFFKKYRLILIISFILVTNLTLLLSQVRYRMNIIPFSEHGTRRLVVVEGNRWFYYRSERNMNLKVEVPAGQIIIKSAVRRDTDQLAFAVEIDGIRQNYEVRKRSEYEDFSIMEDVMITIPGNLEKKMIILTRNRNAYFKVFQREEIRPDFPLTRRVEPDSYIREVILFSEDTRSEYFTANIQKSLSFNIEESYRDTEVNLWGFVRVVKEENDLSSPSFDILFNGDLLQTINLPTRKTGTFFIENEEELELSIGRRVDIKLPDKTGFVEIVPNTYSEMIFRLFIQIDEI